MNKIHNTLSGLGVELLLFV